MDKSFSIAIDIIKIFAGFYGLIAVSVLIYGIISIINRRTRVFKDDESSYGFSKSLTVIDSVISRSFSPFYYHRTIPKKSEELADGPAVLVGWVYIILGILMLAPLAWGYLKFK